MRDDVRMYIRMYSIRSPRGPKARRNVQLRTVAIELCVRTHYEQDQMWIATKFQTLIVVCNAKYSDAGHWLKFFHLQNETYL